MTLDSWRGEIALVNEHCARFGDRLPEALRDRLSSLDNRLAEKS